jgi:hypothetical protein
MLDVSSSKVLCSTFIFHMSFFNSKFIPFMCLYKFFLEEEIDMSACNLSKIIRNIWLQQYRKKGICLFVAMSYDYMQTFRQSSLYYAFLQGGASKIGSNKNELRLHKSSWSRDPVQIVGASKYTSSYGFSIKLPYLEGEEVFGLAKSKVDLPLGS